jgi:hypothetical protein
MFRLKVVDRDYPMVFCQYCQEGTFCESGVLDVKIWMYHHIVDTHRLYRYASVYAYPFR